MDNPSREVGWEIGGDAETVAAALAWRLVGLAVSAAKELPGCGLGHPVPVDPGGAIVAVGPALLGAYLGMVVGRLRTGRPQ